MAKAKTTKGASQSSEDTDKHRLVGDPPILVGGGGSSWIWIKKDLEPQFVDPTKLAAFPSPPDPATVPSTPADYHLLYLAGFTVSRVRVHDGAANQPDVSVPNNPNAKKKHRTVFE